MGTVVTYLLAFIAATLAPAIVFMLMLFIFVFPPFTYRGGARDAVFFGLVALTMSAAHVVVLGVPAFLILRWRRLLHPWSLATGGFVAGGIPIAFIWWPLLRRYTDAENMPSLSILGSPAVMTDGVPTLTGWAIYAGVIAGFGLLGALGGMAFWDARTRLLRCRG